MALWDVEVGQSVSRTDRLQAGCCKPQLKGKDEGFFSHLPTHHLGVSYGDPGMMMCHC